MVEPWSAVPEWMIKPEGDWEALEILLTRNSPGLRDAVVFHAQLRTNSKKIQELVHIHLGLSQQTGECADLDWLVERNDATPAAAPHHHMAALRHGLEP